MESIKKLKIASIGKPSKKYNNTGCHEIVTDESTSRVGVIDIWFGDKQELKTPEEALVYAKLIAAAPELLETLVKIKSFFIENGSTTGHLFEICESAIKKATE